MLDKFLEMSTLFDFYGALLTDKQRQCLEMHYASDLTLSEIADEFGVSRQAVFDLIHRSEQALSAYERKLGLVQRYHDEQKEIWQIREALRKLPPKLCDMPEIQVILERLSRLIGESKGGVS